MNSPIYIYNHIRNCQPHLLSKKDYKTMYILLIKEILCVLVNFKKEETYQDYYEHLSLFTNFVIMWEDRRHLSTSQT